MRFLYYDHVKTIEKGRRIVAVKTFPLSEEYLGRHFSRRPAVPGVILIEAMAQAIGWLAVYSHDFEFSAILSMVEGVEIPAALEPGASAEIHGEIVSTTPRDTLASGRVLVDGEEVASVKRIIFAHFRGASKRETKRRFAYYGGFRGEHISSTATGQPTPAPESKPRRVVVTGMGLVSPLGLGVAQNLRRSLAGDTRAGQVSGEDWEAMVARLPGVSPESPRQQVFALQATEEAMLQARLVSEVPLGERAGVAFGILDSSRIAADSASPQRIEEDAAAFELARRYGLRGPRRMVESSTALSVGAIGAAHGAIREGDADLMLVGTAQGEGAWVAVMESEDCAVERGARILADVAGCAATPKEDRAEPGNALTQALDASGLEPQDVGCLIARGMVPRPEQIASHAGVKAAFGEHSGNLAACCDAASDAAASDIAGFVLAAQRVCRDQGPVADSPAPKGASDHGPGQEKAAAMRAAMIWAVAPEGRETAVVLKRPKP